jgi:hypothetical protein
MDLAFKPDDRWAREQLPHSSNMPASIQDHVGLARQQQTDRTPGCTDVDRFKIGVQHKDGFVHSFSATGTIICRINESVKAASRIAKELS